MTPTPPPPAAETDPRWEAFRSSRGPEVFQSVVSSHDVWKADPFDVEEIHAGAREAFASLLERVAGGQGEGGGKILLLRGESGSGKTHLLRAFRHHTHARRLGWFGYLQMTTNVANYFRYILRNVVDSLSQPYDLEGGAAESGLWRLSNALAENPAVPAEELEALREGDYNEAPRRVFEISERLMETPAFQRAQADLNVLRALLFLQRCEPAFSRRVVSYLRCEAMTGYDREYLGDIPPRAGEDDPPEMLAQLGRLMALAGGNGGGAFVLCLDQLEDIFEKGDAAGERFRRAMQAVRALADANPATIIVIACLDDYYAKLGALLDRSMLDRIERDPAPVRLESRRNAGEVERIVGRRLAFLYEDAGVAFRPEEPVYPFTAEELAPLATLRARGVLQACQAAREHSVLTGERPRLDGGEASATPTPPGGASPHEGASAAANPADAQGVEGRWNDFRSDFAALPPESDPAVAELLAWAVGECRAELDGGEGFDAAAQGRFVEIEAPAIPEQPRRWLVGLCNGRSQGGQLSRQIAELTAAAAQAGPGRAAVAVRASAFPASPKTKIAQQIGDLVKGGGRRAVIEDADWRAMLALREFLGRETGDSPALAAAWRATEKPLTRLSGLRELLLLDKLPAPERPLPPVRNSPPPPAEPVPLPSMEPLESEPPTTTAASETGPLALGRTRETLPKPVLLPVDDLTRHAAFLGGSGSGKTTLALALIESLLLRGIPAILLDRKGDLAAYARPESWTAPLPPGHDVDAPARRQRLRERLDVRLFTPGDAAAGRGRPLGIALLPRGAGQLPGPEREIVARAAASSLGAMMNYRASGPMAPRLAVLAKAITVLAELEPDAEMTLARLADFLDGEDAALVAAIGRLETKLFKKVVQDLETFRLNQGHLLAAGSGPRVDAELLLGLGAHAAPGRTRLSIVSTKFFTDTAGSLFWIAQFLLEISRYAAKRPAIGLQAVVLLDEADLYLPATGRMPPTKEPVENALRRWRSAGIGVLLASQSPGDFDYKCRDNVRHWLVGKVQQDTAIAKMRPMLKEARTDIAAKLPGLGVGQFFLVRDGNVESLAARRALVSPEQLADEEILRLAEGG